MNPRALWSGARVALAVLLAVSTTGRGELRAQEQAGWAAISAEESAFKDVPSLPSAPAVLLFRDIQLNDETLVDSYHVRIKVLTEAGRAHGDVIVPETKGAFKVQDLKARVVTPDGRSREFAGQVYDRMIVKSRYLKFSAKTFSLPDVQPGSIIEFKYKLKWNGQRLFGNSWYIEDDLFTRRARFSIRPRVGRFGLAWLGFRLPTQERPQRQPDGTFVMELRDIAPFTSEIFMPPEEELKARVRFFYVLGATLQPEDEFWKAVETSVRFGVEAFRGKPKDVEKTAQQIVDAADAPEVKLRKLYAWAQQLHNRDFDKPRKKKDGKDEEEKPNFTAKDVIKNGSSYGYGINQTFVTLAQALKIDARMILVARRDNAFFNAGLRDSGQLNADAVWVRLGEQDLFLDPGTRFCPFGMLPWFKTGTQAMPIGVEGAGLFLPIPAPRSADALVERTATLQLSEDGSVRGKVRVRYHGHDALTRRLDILAAEADEWRSGLEAEWKRYFPSEATVKFESVKGEKQVEGPLEAEFSIELPQFAATSGKRMIVPTTVFATDGRNPFRGEKRVHPIYLAFPYQEVDEIALSLPAGFKVEALPQAKKYASRFGEYEISRESAAGVNVRRMHSMNGFYFLASDHGGVRRLFDTIVGGDRDQIVLQSADTIR